jgi:DNA processing protein
LGEGIYHFLKRNPAFAEKVLRGGGFILSQFAPFTAGARWTFPKRNALIAYFGNFGTLVVEAPEKSGALITADFARKLGRKVYAYIGCTSNPNYRGCVNLVSNGGAKLVVEPPMLLNEITGQPLEETKNTTHPLEKLLTEKPRTLDELLALTSMGKQELTALLTQWELEGKVTYQGGFYLWSE